jgi:hypothetical protein
MKIACDIIHNLPQTQYDLKNVHNFASKHSQVDKKSTTHH